MQESTGFRHIVPCAPTSNVDTYKNTDLPKYKPNSCIYNVFTIHKKPGYSFMPETNKNFTKIIACDLTTSNVTFTAPSIAPESYFMTY